MAEINRNGTWKWISGALAAALLPLAGIAGTGAVIGERVERNVTEIRELRENDNEILEVLREMAEDVAEIRGRMEAN